MGVKFLRLATQIRLLNIGGAHARAPSYALTLEIDVIALGKDSCHFGLGGCPLGRALPPAAHIVHHAVHLVDIVAVRFLIPQFLLLHDRLRYRLLRYPVLPSINGAQTR